MRYMPLHRLDANVALFACSLRGCIASTATRRRHSRLGTCYEPTPGQIASDGEQPDRRRAFYAKMRLTDLATRPVVETPSRVPCNQCQKMPRSVPEHKVDARIRSATCCPDTQRAVPRCSFSADHCNALIDSASRQPPWTLLHVHAAREVRSAYCAPDREPPGSRIATRPNAR